MKTLQALDRENDSDNDKGVPAVEGGRVVAGGGGGEAGGQGQILRWNRAP